MCVLRLSFLGVTWSHRPQLKSSRLECTVLSWRARHARAVNVWLQSGDVQGKCPDGDGFGFVDGLMRIVER
jgi:hypothetical protein